MKFYNPFKPHIVKNGFGKYRVRKMAEFGWEYLSEHYTWTTVLTIYITDHETYESAFKALTFKVKCDKEDELRRKLSVKETVVHGKPE